MNSIIEKLQNETSEFKAMFIERTTEWAKAKLQSNIDRKQAYKTIDKSRKDSAYYEEEKFYWKSPSWYFTEEFITRSIQDAEKHYKQSIEKLANKIETKNLNVSDLKVTSVFLGVNLDLTITDGEKKVTANTILAWGEINRPHYRYLVK